MESETYRSMMANIEVDKATIAELAKSRSALDRFHETQTVQIQHLDNLKSPLLACQMLSASCCAGISDTTTVSQPNTCR